jgi:pyridoxamine 5'-phosphate oxidase
MSIADLRKEYARQGLEERDAHADPVEQFRRWFDAAVAAQLIEPNAMTLATATPDGRPSARVVLMKQFDQSGFVFFTNYTSRKGTELAANPYAALLFYWPELERQVRIEGQVARVPPEESEAYFRSRPAGAQISAWASRQSRVIAGRTELERRVRVLEARYAGRDVPRPPHWGGFRLAPELFEFWQGRPSRLHDRLRYSRSQSGWVIERLSP